MINQQREKSVKSGLLHPRNLHGGRYDMSSLCKSLPALEAHIIPNPRGDDTIDFSDSNAVLCLNRALLAHYYQITNWKIPEGYLCPPIPGRSDYIHYASDLLARCDDGNIPRGEKVNVLDIGMGANCIYPIIGSQSYGWNFLATDIDPVAVKAAAEIVQSNPCLVNMIHIKLQRDRQSIFKGILNEQDRFDLTICNPPFHSSMAEAQAGSRRKWKNLDKGAALADSGKRNFGGQKTEIWCPGGEIEFLKSMIRESASFSKQVYWFTSLVSKGEYIDLFKEKILSVGAKEIEVIKMSQGQKISRFIAWTFLTAQEQELWVNSRWK
jgi:23S rRNA (adenine1618-N6)-methyltransferase